MKRRTIALDFDGPIHPYTKGWHDGSLYDPIRPEAVEAMKRFRENGWYIAIHTARGCDAISHGEGVTTDKDQVAAVAAYLDAAGAPYDAIIPKFTADAYIDDRAVLCDPNLGVNWDGIDAMFRWERQEVSDKYPMAVIWLSEDDSYVCLVPGFPGLSAFGDTRMDALANGEIVLSMMVEAMKEDGQELPVPLTISGYEDPLAKRIREGSL